MEIDRLLDHSDWVRNLARHLVNDPDEADDLVQDAWATALESPPRDAASARSWLLYSRLPDLSYSGTRRTGKVAMSCRPVWPLPSTRAPWRHVEASREHELRGTRATRGSRRLTGSTRESIRQIPAVSALYGSLRKPPTSSSGTAVAQSGHSHGAHTLLGNAAILCRATSCSAAKAAR